MPGLLVCRESRALRVALPGAVRWLHRDLRAELQCRVQAKLGRWLHRHHCSPPVPRAVRCAKSPSREGLLGNTPAGCSAVWRQWVCNALRLQLTAEWDPSGAGGET